MGDLLPSRTGLMRTAHRVLLHGLMVRCQGQAITRLDHLLPLRTGLMRTANLGFTTRLGQGVGGQINPIVDRVFSLHRWDHTAVTSGAHAYRTPGLTTRKWQGDGGGGSVCMHE